MLDAGLPVFRPEAAHAVFVDACRFLPHLPANRFPAKALALALYLESGIRADEHFLPESLRARGVAAVRLALPARRYFDDQVRWVADQVADLHRRNLSVCGLEAVPGPPGLAASLRQHFSIAKEVHP
jgi:tyrosine phenol-lyase